MWLTLKKISLPSPHDFDRANGYEEEIANAYDSLVAVVSGDKLLFRRKNDAFTLKEFLSDYIALLSVGINDHLFGASGGDVCTAITDMKHCQVFNADGWISFGSGSNI